MDDKTIMSIPSNHTFGFNIIGYVSGNLGLSVIARNLTRLLLDKGLPVAILDLDPGMGRNRHDLTYEKYFVKTPDELPYGINIFVAGAGEINDFAINMRELFLREDCINILLPMWELTVMPEIMVKAAQLYDVIIAESDFIRSTFENHLSNVRIISAVPPLYLPADIKASRPRFGLPEDKLVFLSGFEPWSDPERKNPLAAIDALLQAFSDNSKACLALYINCPDPKESKLPDFAKESYKKIEEYCSSDSRIHLIHGVMSYVDRLSLYASCDIFVSLHRSEGLGLVPMEFMRLGKPVIATAWSGNMTYMDYANSCLVRHRLIPVKSKHWAYSKKNIGRNAIWAEPDVKEAAAWMRKLADDPDLRAAIGNKAAIDMANFQKKAEEGHSIDEIRVIWEHSAFLPGRKNSQLADFQKVHNDYLKHLNRRLIIEKIRECCKRMWQLCKWIGIRLWYSVFLPIALFPRNCFRRLYRAIKPENKHDS